MHGALSLMTYRLAAIVLLALSVSAMANNADTSYADEDWFPIDDDHYMAVAAATDADMVLHMRILSPDPSTPVDMQVALRRDTRCPSTTTNEMAQPWEQDATVELNRRSLEAESHCEGRSRVFRLRHPDDNDYFYAQIIQNRPITVTIGNAHGQFDNVNGKEALDDLLTQPEHQSTQEQRPQDGDVPTEDKDVPAMPSELDDFTPDTSVVPDVPQQL